VTDAGLAFAQGLLTQAVNALAAVVDNGDDGVGRSSNAATSPLPTR
jgi:hypothetical protein